MKYDIDSLYAAQKEAAERRVRVQDEMRTLEKENAALEVQLEELATTIRTLQRITPVSEDGTEQGESDEDGGLPRGTARKHIESALMLFAPDGKTAGEIRDYINKRHGIEIPANTLSVTLNRLKGLGLARLVGQKWHPASPSPNTGRTTSGWDSAESRSVEINLEDEIPF